MTIPSLKQDIRKEFTEWFEKTYGKIYIHYLEEAGDVISLTWRYIPNINDVVTSVNAKLESIIDKCVEETRKEIENGVEELEEWVEIPNRGVVQEDGGPFIFKIDVLKLLTTPKP